MRLIHEEARISFPREKNHMILYVLHYSLQRGHLETDESKSVMGLCRVGHMAGWQLHLGIVKIAAP